MTCPICQKLHMKLVGVQMTDIAPTTQDKLRGAIEEALADETECTIKVIEADTNGLIMCHAYLDEHGNPQPVHQAHCSGTIPGIPKCRYFVGDQPLGSSLAWCKFRTRQDAERERREKQRAAATSGAFAAQAAIAAAAGEKLRQLEKEEAERIASLEREYNRVAPPPRCIDIIAG